MGMLDDEYVGTGWMAGDSDDDWDFGSDLLDMGKELGGAIWDWGVKNPGTVLTGLATGAKGVMDYYSKDDRGPSSAEYYKERNLMHDQGMRDYVASMGGGGNQQLQTGTIVPPVTVERGGSTPREPTNTRDIFRV